MGALVQRAGLASHLQRHQRLQRHGIRPVPSSIHYHFTLLSNIPVLHTTHPYTQLQYPDMLG